MNVRQMLWAREHDWFDDAAQMPDGDWVVGVVYKERDVYTDGSCGPWRKVFQSFTNFDALRAWAGY